MILVEMVELKRHDMFPTVYRLIELALLLPVAMKTIERAFSSMKIIKIELCSKISDGWFNDLMVCYIERVIFKSLILLKLRKIFRRGVGHCHFLGPLDAIEIFFYRMF